MNITNKPAVDVYATFACYDSDLKLAMGQLVM